MAEIKFRIKIPNVPNFLRIEMPPVQRQDGFTEGPMIRVGDLTDDQLNGLADEWKAKLIETANRQRKEETTRGLA